MAENTTQNTTVLANGAAARNPAGKKAEHPSYSRKNPCKISESVRVQWEKGEKLAQEMLMNNSFPRS